MTVSASAAVSPDVIFIRPSRGFFDITRADGTTMTEIIAQAVFEEHHSDDLEITDHPVQFGAAITDHAYKRPAEVLLRLGWSNSGSGPDINAAVQSQVNGSGADQVRAIYEQLLDLQNSRALFTLYTGKRVYKNMLCKSLATETDYKTANSLPITMLCRQLILVNTRTIDLTKQTQAQPAVTTSTVQRGTVKAAEVTQ